MRPDIESATERVVALRLRVAGLSVVDVPVREIEDALCEGYAEAALRRELAALRHEHVRFRAGARASILTLRTRRRTGVATVPPRRRVAPPISFRRRR